MTDIGLAFAGWIKERHGALTGDVTLRAVFRGSSNDPHKDPVIGVRLTRAEVNEIITSGKPSRGVSPAAAQGAIDAWHEQFPATAPKSETPVLAM